jgi:hypothetical protein
VYLLGPRAQASYQEPSSHSRERQFLRVCHPGRICGRLAGVFFRWIHAVLGFLCVIALQVHGEAPTSAFPAELQTNAPIRRISPGIFEVGKVRIDKDRRTVTFPAVVNMTNGLVEYFVVSATGKLHESVLRTDVEPLHIHLAALLLGAKGAQTNFTVGDFDKKEIPGEKTQMLILVKGDTNIAAEQMVFNSQANAAMASGPWVYNGSQVHDGAFIAQRDGLIVSIISDPLALVNNPRPGRENDEIWQVNTNAVPALNTPVQVEIKFGELK